MAVLACRAPGSAAQDSARVATGAAPAVDSVLRAGAMFRGRATVEPGSPPQLVATVVVESRSRQPELQIESEESGCNPPLFLRPTGGGREVAWSDIAWQARAVRGGAAAFACTGTGLAVVLGPGQRSPFVRRAYPVGAVRGDSLAPGWYDANIAVVLYDVIAPDGRARIDTLRVPAGRVWLP